MSARQLFPSCRFVPVAAVVALLATSDGAQAQSITFNEGAPVSLGVGSGLFAASGTFTLPPAAGGFTYQLNRVEIHYRLLPPDPNTGTVPYTETQAHENAAEKTWSYLSQMSLTPDKYQIKVVLFYNKVNMAPPMSMTTLYVSTWKSFTVK